MPEWDIGYKLPGNGQRMYWVRIAAATSTEADRIADKRVATRNPKLRRYAGALPADAHKATGARGFMAYWPN